jgi:hypothetical protein
MFVRPNDFSISFKFALTLMLLTTSVAFGKKTIFYNMNLHNVDIRVCEYKGQTIEIYDRDLKNKTVKCDFKASLPNLRTKNTPLLQEGKGITYSCKDSRGDFTLFTRENNCREAFAMDHEGDFENFDPSSEVEIDKEGFPVTPQPPPGVQ